MIIRLFYFAILVLFLSSCVRSTTSHKQRSTKYQTFFIGDGVLQYFISSIKLSHNKQESLLMDFTFRTNYTDTSNVTGNFTLKSSKSIDYIQKITFHSLDKSMFAYKPEKIYSEFNNKRHSHRYTIRIPAVDFKTLLSKNVEQVTLVYSPTEITSVLKVSSKGKHKLSKVYHDIVYHSLKDVTIR